MARRRVSPEAQIIALFTGLSDEGKRMVMFGLNAIMSSEAPDVPGVQRARKKAVKEAPKEPEKKEPMCAVCANPADHPDHDTTYLSSHPFALSAGKKSGRKLGASKSTPSTEVETVSVTAVGASGD